jgi:hypothetical protein
MDGVIAELAGREETGVKLEEPLPTEGGDESGRVL